jgi:anti-sigma B factor antagonist
MSKSRVTSVGVPRNIAPLDGRRDGPQRLCLVGELDLARVGEVRARLVATQGDVELDCSGLTFIDASGLSVLVAGHRLCEARGATLTIVDPSPCVARLLALTGLDSILGGPAKSSAP